MSRLWSHDVLEKGHRHCPTWTLFRYLSSRERQRDRDRTLRVMLPKNLSTLHTFFRRSAWPQGTIIHLIIIDSVAECCVALRSYMSLGLRGETAAVNVQIGKP